MGERAAEEAVGRGCEPRGRVHELPVKSGTPSWRVAGNAASGVLACSYTGCTVKSSGRPYWCVAGNAAGGWARRLKAPRG